jgi:hypothetical protein
MAFPRQAQARSDAEPTATRQLEQRARSTAISAWADEGPLRAALERVEWRRVGPLRRLSRRVR